MSELNHPLRIDSIPTIYYLDGQLRDAGVY